jgi:dipeptidyl aminopeptidase/acylaminoacyl peptidase
VNPQTLTTDIAIHPAAPRVATESFRIERRDGSGRALVIRGDVYLGVGARTGVVTCHGFKGFGRWGFYPYLAPTIAAKGFNVVTFDFSGSGVGDDRETYADFDGFACNTYSQELADVAAVAEYARDRGWIGDRYGMFGHSRGGGDAILHASRSSGVAALVTWAAIGHVLRWMSATRDDWRQRGYIEVVNSRTGDVLRVNSTLLEECERDGEETLNIERGAASLRVPWLIVHGSDDETVPVADAERLYAAAGGARNKRVELEIVPGGNHVFSAAHPLKEIPELLRGVVARTAGFFEKHLS